MVFVVVNVVLVWIYCLSIGLGSLLLGSSHLGKLLLVHLLLVTPELGSDVSTAESSVLGLALSVLLGDSLEFDFLLGLGDREDVLGADLSESGGSSLLEFLASTVRAGEDNQAVSVSTETSNVGLERLGAAVLAAVINGNAERESLNGGDLGSLGYENRILERKGDDIR